MKTPKVSLYIRIRRADGTDAFVDPVWNRNRTLRAGYAVIDEQVEHHPEGTYYLRYKPEGKTRRWMAVGSDPDLAIVKLRNTEHDLQAVALGRELTKTFELVSGSAPAEERCLVDVAVEKYLGEVRRFRSAKTISACENMLGRFTSAVAGRQLKDITRDDLLNHMFSLKESGLGERTIHNHISRIESFLKSSGVGKLLRANDKPNYDEKEVCAYSAEDVKSLFAACGPDDRLLYKFFLGTGFREQEVMFCTWANVDFKSKLVSVWSKPEWGFRVKDKEERSVPISDALLLGLAERKKHSTSSLLFPGFKGRPDGHMLRRLQTLAYRAGLNCGECVTKAGLQCSDGPVCSSWGLHLFRKTFATWHAEAGVAAPTIQGWLGHADLSTTQRYLAVADLRSERTRTQVNASFAALEAGERHESDFCLNHSTPESSPSITSQLPSRAWLGGWI